MGQLNVSNITANNIDVNQSLDVNQITSTVSLTAVSASQRPTGVAAGTIIWNTDTLEVEVWNGSDWVNVAKKSGGALPTDGMRVYLDATNTDSYPGSGTTWTDLSGYGNNFQIVNGAFKGGAGSMTGYMDFQGSHGQAKNGVDISLSGDVSYVVVTRIKNSTGQWRTLTRSYNADHHVIVQSGAWNIGMYDNNGSGFIDSGANQNGLSNYISNSWATMIWRFSNTDNPTYEMFVNGEKVGEIRNSNARYNRGFGSIGAYHDGNTNPNSSSQYWGDIRLFVAYNRRITNDEIVQCQYATESQGYLQN